MRSAPRAAMSVAPRTRELLPKDVPRRTSTSMRSSTTHVQRQTSNVRRKRGPWTWTTNVDTIQAS